MPDFNFAKGNTRKQGDRSSPGMPRKQETGQSRPVSVDPPENELPFQLNNPPLREKHGAPGQDFSIGGTAPSQKATSATHGSVLDKYPPRDLSHLDVKPQPPAPASPITGPSHPHTPDVDESDEGIMSESSDPVRTASRNNNTSRWPFIVIGTVVILLVLVALIWHLNPYPPLRSAIAGFFGLNHPVPSAPVPAPPGVSEATETDESELRSWDYYLQVSSWKDLAKADQAAEQFRAQGLDVAVESEALPSRGGTFFRVRLGPYASADEAYQAAASRPGIVPPDAFLDSVRLSEDLPVPAEKRAPRARSSTSRKSGDKTRARTQAQRPMRDFDIVDEPLSGYAVQVSSLKNLDIARIEARKMVDQGYPAFITRARIGGSSRYRVLVGPFTSRQDADKYTKLINVTFGNEAYTTNLSNK